MSSFYNGVTGTRRDRAPPANVEALILRHGRADGIASRQGLRHEQSTKSVREPEHRLRPLRSGFRTWGRLAASRAFAQVLLVAAPAHQLETRARGRIATFSNRATSTSRRPAVLFDGQPRPQQRRAGHRLARRAARQRHARPAYASDHGAPRPAVRARSPRRRRGARITGAPGCNASLITCFLDIASPGPAASRKRSALRRARQSQLTQRARNNSLFAIAVRIRRTQTPIGARKTHIPATSAPSIKRRRGAPEAVAPNRRRTAALGEARSGACTALFGVEPYHAAT